jgi:hypothetical protein
MRHSLPEPETQPASHYVAGGQLAELNILVFRPFGLGRGDGRGVGAMPYRVRHPLAALYRAMFL